MTTAIRTILVATLLLMLSWKVKGIKQVPCFFVFGDSLSDNGNNNNLRTMAKANYQPYGVDFPGGVATGRFTNNRTYIDVLSELLGLDGYIPAFSRNMVLAESSQGVNYASGGAGILYGTSRRNLGEVVSFYQQILNHGIIAAKIRNQVNLNRCLYTINIGSNDYINNYFYNQSYPTSLIFSPTQFASYLIGYYRTYVRILYGLGARKIAVSLLSQIGCSLGEIDRFGATGCVQSVNDAVNIFNAQLVSLVARLSRELPYSKLTYLNSSAIEINAYIGAGIGVFSSSCCPTRSDGQCRPLSTPCSNRDQYFFWDLFHPTNAVHKVIGQRSYKALNTQEAVPYDIKTLVQL